jgi:hypothetical protein
VEHAHLPSYMNEFVFPFNRRRSRSRGLVFYRVLELAIAHDPVGYRDLVLNPQSKTTPPTPPENRGYPPSMDRPRAARPWRTIDLGAAHAGQAAGDQPAQKRRPPRTVLG